MRDFRELCLLIKSLDMILTEKIVPVALWIAILTLPKRPLPNYLPILKSLIDIFLEDEAEQFVEVESFKEIKNF